MLNVVAPPLATRQGKSGPSAAREASLKDIPHSTIDLLILTNSDQLLFILKTLFTCTLQNKQP